MRQVPSPRMLAHEWPFQTNVRLLFSRLERGLQAWFLTTLSWAVRSGVKSETGERPVLGNRFLRSLSSHAECCLMMAYL